MGALMYRGTSTADPNTARSFKGRLLYIQPKQLPVDASGRGDNRRQGGVPQTWSLIPPAMFVDLRLSTLQKLEVYVLREGWVCPDVAGFLSVLGGVKTTGESMLVCMARQLY